MNNKNKISKTKKPVNKLDAMKKVLNQLSATIPKIKASTKSNPNPVSTIQTMKNMSDSLVKNVSKMGSNEVAVTKDAIRWATLYADPFLDKPGSLPALPTLPHQQLVTKISAVATTNAAGYGWVMLRPACAVINDFQCIWASKAGSANYPSVLDSDFYTADSPFSKTDFTAGTGTNGKSFRIVTLGLRVRYIGTTLNAAGTAFTFQLTPGEQGPWDGGVVNFTPQIIRAYGNYKERSFRGSEWHTVTRHILRAEDFLYQNVTNDNFTYLLNTQSGQVSFDNTNTMCILIKCQPDQPFELEMKAHFEIYGPNLSYRTLIKADDEFVDNVKHAYAKKRFQDISTKDHSVGIKPTDAGGWWPTVKTVLQEGVKLVPSLIEMFA